MNISSQPGAGVRRGSLFERMRADLSAGVFAPDERLTELELVRRYAEGRPAVRTAIASLEREGFVKCEPNRGARVRKLGLDEAIDIAQVQRELAGLCAALAAERRTDRDVSDLRALAMQMHVAAASGSHEAVVTTATAFDERLRDAARQPIAGDTLHRWDLLTRRYRVAALRSDDRVSAMLREYDAIVEAVADGDARGARRLADLHAQSVIDALRTVIPNVSS